MHPQRQDILLFDNVTPVAITSSTNATPIVVTSTAHGLVVGQRVLIQGHLVNTKANGIFLVKAATSNTFTLGDEVTNANVAGNGVGGATGFCCPAPQVAFAVDFKTVDFMIATAGSAVVTFQAPISLGIAESQQTSPRGPYPNIGGTIAVANPYSFAQLADQNSGVLLAGTTGIVVNGTDVINQYEANINLAKYITMIPTSWTSGSFTIKAILRTAI